MNWHKLLIPCLLLYNIVAMPRADAQEVRLTPLHSKTVVSFDLNRLYNYNSYERNRWGVGFKLVTPLKYDTLRGAISQNSFIASTYAGYGTGDHAWKYGGAVGLGFPRSVFKQISICYQHDLLRVGSHSFDEYNILNTSANSSYFSSRFSGVDRIGVVAQIDIPGPGMLYIDYSHSRERYLFDASGPLYPNLYDNDTMPYETFNEVGIDFYLGDHWKFGVLTNIQESQDDVFRINNNPLFSLEYLRFLSQYSNKIKFKNTHGKLSLFAQSGFILGEAPVSRQFDISGTGGGRYYFYNTFLTIRPNNFMADIFTLASIRYTTGWSFWKEDVSEPHPFFQLNALWGMLYGKQIVNGTGIFYLNDTPPYRAISLTAPYDGLLEPCIGIDRLLRWGLVDLGIATAYQFTPKNSSYHLDNFLDKFAVMCIVRLILDEE